LGACAARFVCLWHWRCRLVSDAKAQWSGRGVLFSDPAGERLGKEVREPLEPKR